MSERVGFNLGHSFRRCLRLLPVLTALALPAADQWVPVPAISITRSNQSDSTHNGHKISKQIITITDESTVAISASNSAPLRVIITSALPAGVRAVNNSGGGSGQGAFWFITTSIPGLGSRSLPLSFDNPSGLALRYDLAVQQNTAATGGSTP